MEMKTSMVAPVIMGMLLVIQTIAVPLAGDEAESEITADKRPKYMDTRDLEDAFKSLILSAIEQLVVEGNLNSEILPKDAELESKTEKRGRQSLCWRKTNGKVRPFFCWRGN